MPAKNKDQRNKTWNEWRAKNAEKLRKKNQEWKKNNPLKARFSFKKAQAKRVGQEFTITLDDLDWPSHCPVLGLKLYYGVGKGQNDNDPTIDRIDNSKGYVPGNVAVISRRANVLKRDATVSELEALVNWLGRCNDHPERE